MGASEAETRAENAAVKVASGLDGLQGGDGVVEEVAELKIESDGDGGDGGGVGKEEGEEEGKGDVAEM